MRAEVQRWDKIGCWQGGLKLHARLTPLPYPRVWGAETFKRDLLLSTSVFIYLWQTSDSKLCISTHKSRDALLSPRKHLGTFFLPKFSHSVSHSQPQPVKPFLLGTCRVLSLLRTLELSFPLRHRLIPNLALSVWVPAHGYWFRKPSLVPAVGEAVFSVTSTFFLKTWPPPGDFIGCSR